MAMEIAIPERWQTDPAPAGDIAALCGGFVDRRPSVLCPGGGRLERQQFTCLLELAAWGLEHRCDSVWLVPVTGLVPGEGDPGWMREWRATDLAALQADPRFVIHPLTAKGGRGSAALLGGLVIQRRGTDGRGAGRLLRIHAPWVQDAWGLAPLLTAERTPRLRCIEVGLAIQLAQSALGQQLRFSPSYAGTQLFRATLGGKWRDMDLSPCSAAVRDAIRERAVRVKPLQWRRPMAERIITNRRASSILVHRYDRNLAYPTAARVVPVGEPALVDDLRAGEIGFYLVSAAAPREWQDSSPGPFWVEGEYPHTVTHVWAWEPQIRLARRHGWTVHVHQGLAWPKTQQHDLWRDWQARVWAARRRCVDFAVEEPRVGLAAEAIVKRVGRATIGRLAQTSGREVRTLEDIEREDLDPLWVELGSGMGEVRAELGRNDLERPEWWNHIIANANERLLHAALTEARYDLVGLYVDAIYCLLSHPNLAGDPMKAGAFHDAGVALLSMDRVAEGGTVYELTRQFAAASER